MWVANGPRGLVSFLVPCLFAVLPCVIADGWRVWPLLTIWIIGFGVRWYHGDHQLATDSFTFGLLYTWLGRDNLRNIALKRWNDWREVSNVVDELSALYLASGVAIPLAFLGISLWRAYGGSNSTAAVIPLGARRLSFELEVPKARIFPCQTTHARMFPKRHTFAYSYLQCGYPIVPSGIKYSGFEFSSGEDQVLGKWWLRVRAEDYLERGNGERGFYWKLKSYLKEQHVKDSEWSYAYLVTAPRFFGYAFNPVSFWYIYDGENQLKKMVLEVNNTFGERRMYLLDGSSPPSPPQTPGSQRSSASEITGPELQDGAKSNFTDAWMKDFHVSPFNSRKGSYALKALNPFPHVTYDCPMIDNTITLKSSKDNAKIVARLHSTGKALDTDELGLLGTLRFVMSWWWVGLVTFPRIAREAFKLFTKRKLHVWFRPEVQTTSVGRPPTLAEIAFCKVFRNYLFELVHQTEDPFCITFKTSIPDEPLDTIATTHRRDRIGPTRNLEIRVLTPAFYSRLIHYTYTSEAIDREFVFTDERNRTLWMCRPQLLPLLLSKRSPLNNEKKNLRQVKRSYLDELRWMLLRKLRCSPADPAYTVTQQSSAFDKQDIRSRPYSELDNFVRSFRGQSFAQEYRRSVTKLFLAQRFCFGFPEVVGSADLIVRVLLCYLAATQFNSWSATTAGSILAQCSMGLVTRRNWTACSGMFTYGSWWWFSSSAMSVYACHAYGILKGYR